MSPLFRRLALAMTLAIGTGTVLTVSESATAQTTKQKPKETKKADAKGSVEIYEAKDGYRFRIKNEAGKVIAMPTTGVEKKEDVLANLELIKELLNTVKPTEAKGK